MTDAKPSSRQDRLAFLFLWLPYAALVRHFWFVADDAYISFRYSRNWGSGLGLRYNLGDHTPAEGYSNFLMVAAGAVLEKLGLDMQFWLPMLCALAGSLLLWLVFRVLRIRLELSLPSAFLATAMLAWSAPFTIWSSTGLETMPYALFFFATCERLFLRRGAAAGITAGLLALALALTRVEGIGWAILIFPALTILSRKLAGEAAGRALLRYYAVLLIGYCVYYLWRWNLFELAWPTTVYAKVGFTIERALRGVDYLLVQVMTTLCFLAYVPALFATLKSERRSLGLPIAALPFGILIYIVLVGGDWMTFARFLLPAMPFIALGFGWFLEDAARKWNAIASALVGATFVTLGILPGFDVHLVPEATRAQFHYRLNTPDYRSEHAQWEFMRWNGIRWTAKGRALAALDTFDGARPTIVMGAIGAASYVSDCFCLDRHGFVTPEVALSHADPDTELRSPGHDKVVKEGWFVEEGYDPDYLRAKIEDALTRDELLQRLRSSANRLRKAGHDDRYVVDFHQLGLQKGAKGEPTWYLLLWRKIEPGVSQKEAWRRYDAKVERFQASGEVHRLDVEPPIDRVPGLPDWF